MSAEIMIAHHDLAEMLMGLVGIALLTFMNGSNDAVLRYLRIEHGR